MSLDGGKSWLPLSGYALPVVDGARLRSASGSAFVDLTDGSRMTLLPFGAASFRSVGGGAEIALQYGRLTFRLPQQTGVSIVTQAARLDPVRTGVMVGEVLLDVTGTLGVKMTQGRLQVTDLSERREVRLASIEPVFLPKPPVGAVPFASSSGKVSPPPTGGRAVFSSRGESLGYLRPDGQLVLQPGYTSDLSRAFPSKVVDTAMAQVQAEDRRIATPLFDLNGSYAGYVAGPVFYSQAQVAPAAAPAERNQEGPPGQRTGCKFPSPPPNAIEAYEPSGRNVGYVRPSDLRLVIDPAGDLPGPFAPDVVTEGERRSLLRPVTPSDLTRPYSSGRLGIAPPLLDRNGRYLGYADDRFFFAAERRDRTLLIRPVHCGYYAVGAAGVGAAGAGLFFLAEKGVDFSVETEGNSPVKPAAPPPPPPKPIIPP